MFHEDRDIVSKLKQEDAHFARLFNKHNELHDEIELKGEHMPDLELETKKKEKLKLKDELYAIIHDYKNKK